MKCTGQESLIEDSINVKSFMDGKESLEILSPETGESLISTAIQKNPSLKNTYAKSSVPAKISLGVMNEKSLKKNSYVGTLNKEIEFVDDQRAGGGTSISIKFKDMKFGKMNLMEKVRLLDKFSNLNPYYCVIADDFDKSKEINLDALMDYELKNK